MVNASALFTATLAILLLRKAETTGVREKLDKVYQSALPRLHRGSGDVIEALAKASQIVLPKWDAAYHSLHPFSKALPTVAV